MYSARSTAISWFCKLRTVLPKAHLQYNFAIIAKPLQQLTEKYSKFHWNEKLPKSIYCLQNMSHLSPNLEALCVGH